MINRSESYRVSAIFAHFCFSTSISFASTEAISTQDKRNTARVSPPEDTLDRPRWRRRCTYDDCKGLRNKLKKWWWSRQSRLLISKYSLILRQSKAFKVLFTEYERYFLSIQIIPWRIMASEIVIVAAADSIHLHSWITEATNGIHSFSNWEKNIYLVANFDEKLRKRIKNIENFNIICIERSCH